jgi:hypothetical protein
MAGLVVFLFALYWTWTTLDTLRMLVAHEFQLDTLHVITVLVVVAGWVAILT